jgi:hypothetical protein
VDPEQSIIPMHGKAYAQPPDRVAHVDMTAATACRLLHKIKGDNFDASERRVRFIKYVLIQSRASHRVSLIYKSVWRPYESIVTDCPLALRDGRTVDRKSLVAVDSISQQTHNEIYILAYDHKAEWFFLNHQQPDEVLLFKNFDSRDTVPAPCMTP